MILKKYHERKKLSEQEVDRDEGLSGYEKTIYFLGFCLLICLKFIAAWSGFLLLTEKIQGGGPIGLLMEMLPLHLLL